MTAAPQIWLKLASPPVALVVSGVCAWLLIRSRWLGSRAAVVGLAALAAVASLAAVGGGVATWGPWVQGESVALLVLVVGSLAMIGAWLRQHGDGKAEALPPAGFGGEILPPATLALGGAILFLGAWLPGVPSPASGELWLTGGVRQLGHGSEPFYARVYLPLVLATLLFMAPNLGEMIRAGSGRLQKILIGVWLVICLQPLLLAVLLPGVAFGGPQRRPLSELFWIDALETAPPPSWLARELPGLVLLLLYFVGIPFFLSRWRGTADAVEEWRTRWGARRLMALALLALAVGSIPLRVLGSWLLGMSSVIRLPEMGIGF